MSGLLGAFNIDMDTVEAPSFDVKDDTYEFVVGDLFLVEGTKNHPDRTWLVLEFLLGDDGKKKSEWFELPADSDNPTPKEMEKLGYMKLRLKALEVPDEKLNSFGPEDVIGKRGVFTLATKNGFQNIRNFTLSEDQDPAPVAEKPVVRRKAAAKPVAQAAPVAEEVADDSEEEPEEAPATPVAKAAVPSKAAAAGVRKNPFAPK